MIRRRLQRAKPTLEVRVHPQVMTDIESGCLTTIGKETGGPLLGKVERSWNGTDMITIVSVLATIAPADDVDGHPTAVTLGGAEHGARASAATQWWSKVSDVDLAHVGDWHLHPSGLAKPSSGDERTAHDMLDASATGVWLVAIALADVRSQRRERLEHHNWSASISSETVVDVRTFSAASRSSLVAARVIVDPNLLTLPPLPWHLICQQRLHAEVRLLAAAGHKVAMVPAIRGVAAGATLCVQASDGTSHLICTPRDYPVGTPMMLKPNGKQLAWSAHSYLIDLLEAP